MSHFYVACDFGADNGRISFGTFHHDKLTVSEVRRFPNLPMREKDSIQWNIPQLYHEMVDAMRQIGSYEEPIDSISCTSWPCDYLLFEADGSLITPTYHFADPRSEAGHKRLASLINQETVYEETGVQRAGATTLVQLAAENPKRLKRAHHLLPIADGFNYLLSGVPRVEVSQASASQLYSPANKAWSTSLLSALRANPSMLPPIVSAGTTLGPLRPDIAKETRLEDARVLSSCSHDLAATLTALPVDEHETCAFLQPGRTTLLGVQVDAPIISDGIRELRYTNESGYNGAVCFYKRLPGLWILEECRRYWKDTDRDVDGDMLTHLAGSAPPFESLINPADPRFLTPGEMPLKIQAFCKDTGQAAPRKPGPVYRCILESLALYYRKIFEEIEQLTGGRVNRVNILGSGAPPLLNHFITNACQLPALVVPEQATAAGNILIQAIGLGHIKSIAQAREVVRNSIKMETLLPHANAWNSAYDRLVSLSDVEQAEALDE